MNACLAAGVVAVLSCSQRETTNVTASEVVEIARQAASERYRGFDFKSADVSIDNVGDAWLVGFIPQTQRDSREITGDIGIFIDKKTHRISGSYYNNAISVDQKS